MHTHHPCASLLLLLVTTTFSTASATVVRRQSGPVFLGRPCTPGSTTCVGGAQCYAVNSNLNPTCGNFGASCTGDAQCATNTCVQGVCDGLVAPVLPLGSQCYESQQCVGGAGCYAVNAMEIPTCGNFQAECTSSAQCATNACVDGFCNGPLLPSSSSSVVVGTSTVTPTTSLSPSSVSASTSALASASTSSVPVVTSPTSTPSSSPSAPSLSSSGQSAPTSAPTSASTTTITTFTTTTSCPSMSTIIPLSTGTGQSSATGNSTIPTTARPSPTVFQGAGEQLRAGCGAVIVAAALGFALMIGA